MFSPQAQQASSEMKTFVPAALSVTCVGFHLSKSCQVDGFIIAGLSRPSRAALQGTSASQPVGGFHGRRETDGRVVCRMTSESADGAGNTTRGFGQPNVSKKASEKKQEKTKRIVPTDDGKKQGSERRQLFLQFECNQCNGVSQFMINKDAYENGIVICTCQKCGVRHLLADNLKKMDVPYFGNNIEEYMHSKGSPEEITKGTAPGLTPEVLEKFDVSVGADGVLNLRPKSESA